MRTCARKREKGKEREGGREGASGEGRREGGREGEGLERVCAWQDALLASTFAIRRERWVLQWKNSKLERRRGVYWWIYDSGLIDSSLDSQEGGRRRNSKVFVINCKNRVRIKHLPNPRINPGFFDSWNWICGRRNLKVFIINCIYLKFKNKDQSKDLPSPRVLASSPGIEFELEEEIQNIYKLYIFKI